MPPAQQNPAGDAPLVRDRSTALVLVGGAVIAIGLLCALMLPLTWVASRWSAAASGEPFELRVTLPVMVVNGLLATVLVVLGVGSMRARAWACELLLAVSRVWLLTGICALLLAAVLVPGMMRSTVLSMGADPAVAMVASLIAFGLLAVTQIAVPAGLVLFYGSADVAATCRARDPGRQAASEVPRPVLTLAAVWALAGVSVLVMPSYNLVFPWFGTLLYGADGIVPWAVAMFLCAILTWGTVRRVAWAWWGGLAVIGAALAATVTTSLSVDWVELLAALRLPESQAAMWASLPRPGAGVAAVFWAVVWSSFAAYVVKVRGFFCPVAGGADA